MTDIQLAIKIISLFGNLNCLKFQETEKSGAIYYIPQGGPLTPLIYCPGKISLSKTFRVGILH